MLSWPILLCSLLNLSSKLCSLLRREKFNICKSPKRNSGKTSPVKIKVEIMSVLHSVLDILWISCINITGESHLIKINTNIFHIFEIDYPELMLQNLLVSSSFHEKGEKLSPILPFPSLQQWTTLHSGSVARRLFFSVKKNTNTIKESKS